VIRPALVLADEPTGNLDTRTAADLVATPRELNRAGTTVVLITHSLEVAAHAHRTLRIVDGLIVADERRMAATELAA
jgi:putative ABC transport system ATP-binding protein